MRETGGMMDSQVRQTYIAMFFVITFIISVIHGLAIFPFAIAVDSETAQFVAKVLTAPVSFFHQRIDKLPELLRYFLYWSLGPGLWDMTIASTFVLYGMRRSHITSQSSK